MHRLAMGLLLAALTTVALGAAERNTARDPLQLQLDPQRVRWESMTLQARKFIFTASTSVDLSFLPAERVLPELIETERGVALIPDGAVSELVSVARFFGRQSQARLYMSPVTAAAYQYVVDEDGSHAKHRYYRYTDRGIFVLTYKPENDAQRDRNWQEWTRIATEWRKLSKLAWNRSVVEPLGLLYVVGAAELPMDGRPLELLSISDRKATRLSLRAFPAQPRRVSFALETPGGKLKCKGTAPAIRIDVDGTPLDPQESSDGFEFLGLEEDIAIFVEPESRLVLEVSGKAPVVGRLTIRLKEARLRGKDRCPTS